VNKQHWLRTPAEQGKNGQLLQEYRFGLKFGPVANNVAR